MKEFDRGSNVSWLVTVPCNDGNYEAAKERATIEELNAALEVIKEQAASGQKVKSKLQSIERAIKKRQKGEK